ncbi:energy transducer TonB [Pelagicoccus sp. SDUM812003]|uniref:energy transducer TonB n=1 Tax=Pelagicoccus sp. SDUM812003 TaxID=3041267 RepID=UPI00280FC7D5|nr:energy transducer TonB [Pelagicoccus sp. SDUM812003]MDQ8203783.1 energy transducer TonB [Pelagicoccus sp. SDUM812003]
MSTPRFVKLAFAAMVCGGFGLVQSSSAEESQTPQPAAMVSQDAYVLETVKPDYPVSMLQRGIQGRTLLKLRVSSSGEVDAVQVVATTNKAFSEAAMKSVKHWYFEPGKADGVPISQTVLVPVDFVIEDLPSVSIASL